MSATLTAVKPIAPVDEPVVAAPIPTYVTRFDARSRWLHLVIMTTFLGLSATGMPLLFSDAPWARMLAALFFGFRGAGLAHRFFGAVLLLAVAFHIGDVLWRGLLRGERGIFWGPTSMVPQPRDFCALAGGHAKLGHNAGRRQPAQCALPDHCARPALCTDDATHRRRGDLSGPVLPHRPMAA